jgi:hypothetical protein
MKRMFEFQEEEQDIVDLTANEEGEDAQSPEVPTSLIFIPSEELLQQGVWLFNYGEGPAHWNRSHYETNQRCSSTPHNSSSQHDEIIWVDCSHEFKKNVKRTMSNSYEGNNKKVKKSKRLYASPLPNRSNTSPLYLSVPEMTPTMSYISISLSFIPSFLSFTLMMCICCIQKAQWFPMR